MANRKISELTSRTPSLTDLILVGDPSSGYSYKATVTALATIIETDIADAYVTLDTTQTISGLKTFSNNIRATSIPNAVSNPNKFLVLNGSDFVNYRTGSQVLSDIGGADDTLVVHKAGDETITGIKKFTSRAKFDNSINLLQGGSASIDTGYSAITADSATFYLHKSGSIFASLNVVNLTTSRTYTLQDAAGTLAFTSDISGAVSGTTNYIPKFTSSNVIGNSVIYESSSNIGIGTTTPSAKLSVNGNAILSGSLNATETYLDSPNGLVFELNSSNANGGYADFKTNSTIIGRIGTATQVLGSGGTSVFAISSRGANAFVLGSNGTEGIRIANGGAVSIANIANATTDTDKFLVSDGGVVKYRTGAEVLSDIGGASSSSISGTTNYIPKFTSSSAIGNSVIYEASGSIGIGTTTPNLSGGASGSTILTISASSSNRNGILELNGTRANSGEYAGYVRFFNNAAATPIADIQAIRGSSDTNGSLAFAVSNSEQMRLTSTGLGIGTSSPAYNLDVSGSSTTRIQVKPATNTNAGIFQVNNGGGTFYIAQDNSTGSEFGVGNYSSVIWRSGAYPIVFATNDIARMRLDASGNLGLGVSPSAWYNSGNYVALQVGNASLFGRNSTNSELYLSANTYYNSSGIETYITSNYASQYRQNNSIHSWHIAPSGTAGNAISFTQAMTLDASGRLGIGTTSPSAKLEVRNDSNTAYDASTGTTNRILNIRNATSGTGYNAFINFITEPNGEWYLGAVNKSNYSDFVFMSRDASYGERMRITSGGNVGIGTTAPSHLLHVQKDQSTYTWARIDNQANNASAFAGLQLGAYGNTWGLAIGSSTANSNSLVFLIDAGGTNAERMRITSGGELLINTTSDAGDYKLQVNGNALIGGEGSGGSGALTVRKDGGVPASISNESASGTLINFSGNGSGVLGSISHNGSSVAYNTTSDYRLKQDLKDFNGLSLVNNIKVYDYQWKANGTRNYGVMAHELQSVIPYAVTGVKDGETMQGVDYSKIVPVLVKAIQELKAEIETLKNK